MKRRILVVALLLGISALSQTIPSDKTQLPLPKSLGTAILKERVTINASDLSSCGLSISPQPSTRPRLTVDGKELAFDPATRSFEVPTSIQGQPIQTGQKDIVARLNGKECLFSLGVIAVTPESLAKNPVTRYLTFDIPNNVNLSDIQNQLKRIWNTDKVSEPILRFKSGNATSYGFFVTTNLIRQASTITGATQKSSDIIYTRLLPDSGYGLEADPTYRKKPRDPNIGLIDAQKAMFEHRNFDLTPRQKPSNQSSNRQQMIKSYKDGQPSNSQPAAKSSDNNPKVLVAIIDSGIDMRAGNGTILSKVVKRYLIATKEAGNPVEKDDPDEQDAFTGEDNNSTANQPNYPGHATPIAFLIANIAPNVDFLSIRVCNKYGDCNPGNVDRAIAYTFDYAERQKDSSGKHKYKRGNNLLNLVINLSLGSSLRFDSLYNPTTNTSGSTVQKAITRGAVVVAAGGGLVPDNNCDEVSGYKYPAADGIFLEGLIGVGGVQWNIMKSRWEKIVCGINAGNIELWAPGRQVMSLGSRPEQDSYFYWFDGSSFATAQVTGVVALLMSKNSTLTAPELEYCLKKKLGPSKLLQLDMNHLKCERKEILKPNTP